MLSKMIAFLLLLPPAAEPQTPDPQAVFETASIKMVSLTGGGGHSHESGDPGMFRGLMTLKSYIMTAYGVKAFQVTGGPNWIDATTYEIVAKLENPRVPLSEKLTTQERLASEEERLHLALQTLLSERFQLKFHRDPKEMPAYALMASKSGFKLKAVPETNDCGTRSTGNGASRKLTATCIDMAGFARFLARQMRLPIFDQTHVQGVYSFTMEWTPDDLKTLDSADQDALPSIFTVLDKQLGLKLDPKKAPVEIIVVDGAERPSEN